MQFAHRRFDFPSVSFEPYLQIPNTLDMGRHVNAVDATQETRYEAGDTVSYLSGTHNVRFGGNLYHLRQNFVLDASDPALVLFPNLDAFLGKPPFPPFPFPVLFDFVVGPNGERPPAPLGFTKSANFPLFDAYARYRNGLARLCAFRDR